VNRRDRQTQDAITRRTGSPSVTLLQQQIQRLEQERQAMQDLLYAIVLSQGRVRVRKADMHALKQGDRLDVREVGDDFYLTIEKSNMLAGPNGVEGGKPRGAGEPWKQEPDGAA
jgi:hypothetical protein